MITVNKPLLLACCLLSTALCFAIDTHLGMGCIIGLAVGTFKVETRR